MADNWNSIVKQEQPELITEKVTREAQWWATNRFAKVREPFPVERKPFKPMTKLGFEKFEKDMLTIAGLDSCISKVMKPYIGEDHSVLEKIKVAIIESTKDIDNQVEEEKEKAIKKYANTVFVPYDMELTIQIPGWLDNMKWLAYLHYSKEQHELYEKDGNSNNFKNHVLKHGQLVKMDS